MGKGKLLLAGVTLVCSVTLASAQKKEDFKLSAYGFFDIRSYFDTRRSVAGADNYLYLYPLSEKMAGDKDLNENRQSSLFGSTARFGFNLTGPKVLGADSRVNVEFDIFNYSSSGHFLFRHGYMGLDWENSSLVLGHTWHPMSKLIPAVGSISLGSPFNALSRSGQLRYDYRAGDGLTLTGAAMFQSLGNSMGPSGKSFEYQRDAMMPELYLGLALAGEKLSFETGGLYQKLCPAHGSDGTKQYVDGFAGMAQLVYKDGKFQAMAKTYLGQNMSQLGFCTGYGKVAGSDGEWAPLLASSSWLYADYGQAFKVGFFAGYMKNLGALKDLELGDPADPTDDMIYVSGGNIDRMYRIAPNMKYKSGNTLFCLEYDMTGVSYGQFESKGTVAGDAFVMNSRILISATYLFNL